MVLPARIRLNSDRLPFVGSELCGFDHPFRRLSIENTGESGAGARKEVHALVTCLESIKRPERSISRIESRGRLVDDPSVSDHPFPRPSIEPTEESDAEARKYIHAQVTRLKFIEEPERRINRIESRGRLGDGPSYKDGITLG